MSGWDTLIAAYAPKPPVSWTGGAGKVTPEYVISGLVQRGLPRHVAEGFAMNIGDESGFDPGINERNPTVPGSRGGFGLYQLTGPRRRAYEAFAAQRGAPLNDPDAQLDFLVRELQGPEQKAAQSILGAQTAGEAGAAIVRSFLRPAAEHRDRRAAKYLGGKVNFSGATSGREAADMKPLFSPRLWLDFGGSVG